MVYITVTKYILNYTDLEFNNYYLKEFNNRIEFNNINILKTFLFYFILIIFFILLFKKTNFFHHEKIM